MRAFAAVFAREVFERRMVFLVGLCCGLPMLVASALHGWSAPGNAEVRLLAATVGGLALAAALALLYGASMIAGETAEKRISFSFSRPLPDVAIWAGKLFAAVFLSFSAGLLVFLPGWLTGPARASTWWGFETTAGRLALVAVALVTTCVLASHAFVTVARLRSPWVALDLVLAPALVLLATIFLRSLARNFGGFEYDGVLLPPVLAIAVVPLLALLVASFVQVAEGRTDARRAHGAFSVAFFGIVGSAVAVLGGYAWWCASARATDLQQVSGGVQAAFHGPWLVGAGPLTGARGGGTFLFDASSGRSLRLHGSPVTFSADGSRAAWGEPRFGFFERKDNRSDIFIADLVTGRPVATGLETYGWNPLALSPSGRRLALRDGRTLAAYDVSDPANPRQLAAFSLADDRRVLAFVDEDTIRLFPGIFNHLREAAPTDVEVAELSLPSKKSLVTGRFDRETLPFLRMSADGRFFVGVRDQRLTLHDGRTGSVLSTLGENRRMPQARFLTGGRVAVAGVAGGKGELKIFLEGEEGRPPTATRTIDLGPAARMFLGGEIAPGRIAVAFLPFEENLPAFPRVAKLAAVDVASGAVSPVGEGLIPANRGAFWLDPVMPPAEGGAPWTSLFLDASGRLVRLDPASGAQTVLLGKGK